MSHDERQNRAPLVGWEVVPLLMAISFVCYVNRVSIATAGDTRIMAEYEISPERMGTVYSAFLFTYTLCMIPGGLYIDWLGPRGALLTVLLGSTVFVVLTGAIGVMLQGGLAVYAALLVVRGLMGIVSAPLYPACAAAIGRWVSSGGRSRANGLVNGAAVIGVAITPLAFGALIDRFDWPLTFCIAACVTLILSLVWYVYGGKHGDMPQQDKCEEKGADIATGDHLSWWNLLRNRGLILVTFSYAAVGYFQYLFFYWMNYYFQAVLELPKSTSRFYAMIPPLAMAVGMPLGGWLTDRLEHALGAQRGRKLAPMAGMILGAGLLICGVNTTEPAWIVMWFALAMGAVGMAEGASWVTAIELGGRRGGSSAGLLNTGGNAGGMLAPVLTPWIGQHYGWEYAVGLGAIISLVGALFWLGIEIDEDKVEGRRRLE